ncbi:MAG: hypothetical protein ACO4AU_10265, partial [bacterium]
PQPSLPTFKIMASSLCWAIVLASRSTSLRHRASQHILRLSFDFAQAPIVWLGDPINRGS